MRRDVEVFIRTYAGTESPSRQLLEDSLDCPLVELGLLLEQEIHRAYLFVRGPKDSLPDLVLLYALWDYMRRKPEQHSFTFDDLSYSPLSPGRAFKLDESSLAERLERLPDLTDGRWRFSETEGYRQLLTGGAMDGIEFLDRYYRRATATVERAAS